MTSDEAILSSDGLVLSFVLTQMSSEIFLAKGQDDLPSRTIALLLRVKQTKEGLSSSQSFKSLVLNLVVKWWLRLQPFSHQSLSSNILHENLRAQFSTSHPMTIFPVPQDQTTKIAHTLNKRRISLTHSLYVYVHTLPSLSCHTHSVVYSPIPCVCVFLHCTCVHVTVLNCRSTPLPSTGIIVYLWKGLTAFRKMAGERDHDVQRFLLYWVQKNSQGSQGY